MTSIRDEVTKSVNDLTKNRRLFTAYDVTQIVRYQLDGERVSHKDVKKEVHALFDNDEMGIYERTQANVGTKVSPFVYHLTHQVPSTDYDKDWVGEMIKSASDINPLDGTSTYDGLDFVASSNSASKVVKGSRVSTPTVSFTPGTVSQDSSTYDMDTGFDIKTVTNERRLNIPSTLLSGFVHAYVFECNVSVGGQDQKGLKIVPNVVGSTGKKYYVFSTRLRVSEKHLKKISNDSTFRVKRVNDEILITAN
jgi:hypothetical protein